MNKSPLSNGIDRNVWVRLASALGCTDPDSPDTITRIADAVRLRRECVVRWYKLSTTDYPVHRKSSLCRVADIIGAEMPTKIDFKERRPTGYKRVVSEKTRQAWRDGQRRRHEANNLVKCDQNMPYFDTIYNPKWWGYGTVDFAKAKAAMAEGETIQKKRSVQLRILDMAQAAGLKVSFQD